MRQVATFLLIALALPAIAAETWRWKDEHGVVHYSDQPVPGAERVNTGPAGPGDGPAVRPQSAPPPRPEPPRKFSYTECIVLAPGNDQTFNAVNTVTASLQITPQLQPGHRMQVILDGNVYTAWPARMLTFKLENIYRGTHTLGVQILDADNEALCKGPVISFHVRQPSILSPARKPAPKKP
jgi:hypothetical protein